ncbi:hypothetical protein C8Q75DRAFT_710125 [Abortiporus biennis]|nr:hypothetical protein C8Q75DRAFT_710125 [Abortiporus biennis]
MSGALKDAVLTFSASPDRLRTVRARAFPKWSLVLYTVIATAILFSYSFLFNPFTRNSADQTVPVNAQRILQQCASLKIVPGPGAAFHTREVSDRFEPGTKPTLIKNATIWTGLLNGTEIFTGDVFLKNGIVKRLGKLPKHLLDREDNLVIVEANGAWVTPGLVDLHTHLGILSAPVLGGTFDLSSPHGPVVPWLRSIDAFNTHDDSFEHAIAGGVTTAQILPGSGNAIGGQAFMVKLRPTAKKTPTSMLLEPPVSLWDSGVGFDGHLPWRHLKQACGENVNAYGTRMDTMWWYRSAYDGARKIKEAQDDYCMKAEAGLWNQLQGQPYPENLQWEALVDVLRGRVKISTHCYEAIDLDALVRLTNEFQFPIASIHHASEAYLVPETLKKAFGGPPAIALFANHNRFKREAYRGSEFAPRILADNGIPVIMKSDHPVLDSRHVLYEAQQAHYYGLQPHLALTSVTSTPAEAAGLSHRIGSLQEGADADIVIWDSHPLQLGATPRQVWIDGIPQLNASKNQEHVLVSSKKTNEGSQEIPRVPSWDSERLKAIQYDGLPPLEPERIVNGPVILTNVAEVWERSDSGVKQRWSTQPGHELGTVVLADGRIACVGGYQKCVQAEKAGLVVDIHGGSVGPGLISAGSTLGIEEMELEASTGPGPSFNPYLQGIPAVLEDTGGLVRTVDSLKFATRDALIAHRSGVTYGVSTLRSSTFTLETTFRTGASHSLESNAVIRDITALHVHIERPIPYSAAAFPPISISTQIAGLRRLLLNSNYHNTETGYWFDKAAEGAIPLIISVNNADIMATLLRLKADVEEQRGTRLNMIFNSAIEAHLLAKEIAEANAGVIMTARQVPLSWDSRRIIARPPLTNTTAIATLVEHGVTVGLGVIEATEAASIRFDAAWAALEADGRLTKAQTYELVTTNLEKMFGIADWIKQDDALVIYDGGDIFSLESKVIGIASPSKGNVEFF